MLTLLFLAASACGQAEDDKLLARLDADVRRLLANDPHAEKMRQAVRLLEETNNSDKWTNYSSACAILRETRSKAGVPLLLAFMIRHAGLSSSGVPEYAQTLTILTGKDIPNPYKYVPDRVTPVRKAVEGLVAEWWEPEQDKITTDITRWSQEQLNVLGARMLERSARGIGSSYDPASWRQRPTAYAVYHYVFYSLLSSGGSSRPDCRLEELHPKMLPLFLAEAGYRPHPDKPLERDTSRPAYAAIELLAALRRNGELQELEQIAEDENQSVGVRMTCAFALLRADEKLRLSILLPIAASDPNLERRLVALIALRGTSDRAAGKTLVDALDHENAEIRTAAVCAVAGPQPPQAIVKLKRIIDSLDTPQAMLFVFAAIGEYKNHPAREALAAFLEAALEDGRKAKHLSYALSAFESASGQQFKPQKGESGDEADRSRAKEAIAWWKAKGKLIE